MTTRQSWYRWTQSLPSVLFGVFSGVWIWFWGKSAHKPPRSSCSFMWARPLWRADLAPPRAVSLPKPPSFICRSDSARPEPLYPLAFYLEAKQIWTLSLYLPPVSLCLRLSVTFPRTAVSPRVYRFRLSLSSFSLSPSPVTRSVRPSPCIHHLPHKQMHASDTSA